MSHPVKRSHEGAESSSSNHKSSKGGPSSLASSYSVTKDFGGYYGFAASYGLKPGDEEEVDGLIDAFKENDEAASKEDSENGGLPAENAQGDSLDGESDEQDEEQEQEEVQGAEDDQASGDDQAPPSDDDEDN